MSKRVVITAVGVVAPNAKGRAEYWQALKNGVTGFRPITLFDAEEFRVKQAGEITDFDPKVFMGPKGLRLLDRATTLAVSAAKLAHQELGFTITEENTDDLGVSTGTTFGSLKSIVDFDMVTLTEGPRYVNPALFPNTVMNSPGSQVSIWLNIQGFNTTISTGFTASLDAIRYAYDFIQYGRAKIVFAGGVEEFCMPTFFGFHAVQYLSGSKEGEEFISCPFDRRRNGVVFGEGACYLVVEELEHALARGANILGEIISFGYCFDPFRLAQFNPKATGLKEAIPEALDNAGMSWTDLDYVSANANSSRQADKVEARAFKDLFGSDRKKVPMTAIKSMVGETYSVSGALAVAAALGSITENFIPPTVGYSEPDEDIDLNVVAGKAVEKEIKNVMVVNFGPSASNHAVILRKYIK